MVSRVLDCPWSLCSCWFFSFMHVVELGHRVAAWYRWDHERQWRLAVWDHTQRTGGEAPNLHHRQRSTTTRSTPQKIPPCLPRLSCEYTELVFVGTSQTKKMFTCSTISLRVNVMIQDTVIFSQESPAWPQEAFRPLYSRWGGGGLWTDIQIDRHVSKHYLPPSFGCGL